MSTDPVVLGLLAILAVASVVCAVLALRAPTAAFLHREGDRFARRHELFVEGTDIAVVDAFVVRERRFRLLVASAGCLMVGALAWFSRPGYVVAANWVAALSVVAFLVLNAVHAATGEPDGTSERVPLREFIPAPVRFVNGFIGLTGLALLVRVSLDPGPYVKGTTYALAAAPILLALLAEAIPWRLARRSTARPAWIAYLHDSRRYAAFVSIYSTVPLVGMALGFVVGDLTPSDAGVWVIVASGLLAFVEMAALRRHGPRFMRSLWPHLAPGEIVSSWTA